MRRLYLPAQTRRRFITAIWLATAAWLTLASTAYADVRDIESSNNQLVAQIQRTSITYTETVNDGTGNPFPLDSESGRLTTYALSGSVMKDLWLGHDYVDARYSYFSGRTAYTGGTMANPAYGSMLAESGARIGDGSLRYGTGFVLDREAMATLYAELGSHKYVRTLGLGMPVSYQETYTHAYYGLGVLVQWSPITNMVFSFNALIGRTHQSNIVIVFPAPYAGFSARLGDSTLEKIGFGVDYALTRHFHANAGVEMMAWSYGASASQPIAAGLYIYEPDSRTYVATAKAGLGFAF